MYGKLKMKFNGVKFKSYCQKNMILLNPDWMENFSGIKADHMSLSGKLEYTGPLLPNDSVWIIQSTQLIYSPDPDRLWESE